MKRLIATTMLCASCCAASHAVAQHKIEWQDVMKSPKGMNLPAGLKADILGIELGDSYAELKPKLDALVAEALNKPRGPVSNDARMLAELTGDAMSGPMTELKIVIRSSQAPGANALAEYVGQINIRREMPGTRKISVIDYLTLRLSAPSSGHQVLGMERYIDTRDEENHYRVEDVMGGLKAKFKSEPVITRSDAQSTLYRFQFNNGQAVAGNPVNLNCVAQYDLKESNAIARINPTGECDVVLLVNVVHGISKAHARSVRMALSDNERTKANVTADFKYIQGKLNEFLNQPRGTAPKL